MATNKDQWGFASILASKALNNIPRLIGDKVVDLFKENFDKESFFGDKWEEVKRREPGTYEYKYGTTASQTNPILTDSTQLRKSIKVIKANMMEIIIGTVGTDVNRYAQVHNEGDDTHPQRQFIGTDIVVTKAIDDIINKELDKMFRL